MSHLRFHIIVCLLLTTVFVDIASAQAPNRRRQFVQGLLKTLIDSQLPRENGQATRPVPSSQPSVRRHASPQLREASRLLVQASDEMSRLVGALQGDLFRAQGVRQLLSLAMSINADAAVLSQRFTRATDIEPLREPLRNLDQNWRTLEYRLGQTDNLSASTLGHIERIRQYESRLATMFNVQTQVDMATISEHALQMNSSLRNLLEDIRFEVTDPNTANRLTQDGRDTYDQLQRFIQTTRSNASYEALKQDYNSLETEWLRYERQLRRLNNRFVQRQSQRISDSARQIKGLLYLTSGQVNRDDLIHATRLLQRDTDLLLRRVNLKMLAELPAARRFAIEAAGDFDTTCGDMLGVLEAGDGIDVIRDMYMFMHDEWQRLNMSLQGISSQQARQSMRDIERSLTQLQTAMGIQFDLDRNQAVELATALLADARHLQTDVRDIFARPNRYSREFQTNSLRAAAQFQTAAGQLQAGLSDGEKLRQLKTRCDAVSTVWETLCRLIPRIDAAEQMHLNKIQRRITPQVVRMQTLLSI